MGKSTWHMKCMFMFVFVVLINGNLICPASGRPQLVQ